MNQLCDHCKRPARIFCLRLALLWLLASTGIAHAKTLQMMIEKIETPVAKLSQIDATLRMQADAQPINQSSADKNNRRAIGELELRIAELTIPLLQRRDRALVWRCPVFNQAAGGNWLCDGELRVSTAKPQRLSIDLSAATTNAMLQIDNSQIALSRNAASPDSTRLELQRVPLVWVEAFLKSLWAEGIYRSGSASGTVDLRVGEDEQWRAQADLKVSKLSVDTADGLLAAADIDTDMKLDYRQQLRAGQSEQTIDLSLKLGGGELLADTLYVPLPKQPVYVDLSASQRGNQGWQLPKIRWRDPKVLDVAGSTTLGSDFSLQSLDLRVALDDLNIARDRYLSGFLAPTGFGDAALTGKTIVEFSIDKSQLSRIELDFAQVSAIDARGRFILAGVNGDLRWSSNRFVADSQLGWANAAVYGIGLGRGQMRFESREGQLRLREPTQVQALGGGLSLTKLLWTPPTASEPLHIESGLQVDALDLASLSQRLGWPPFTGTISGRIPTARYRNNLVDFDGGLAMQLFGGEVSLRDLQMERPFGVAPTLSGNVRIEDIDLQPLTGVFGFGEITGRLDGSINDLRLVAWSPVAFTARLDTDRAWDGKRRISQRAVQDISSVGGSGLIAGIQGRLLSIFSDFGYSRIGIGCRLRDNVCTMDGLDSAGNGYTIVDGAGLPRINVVGFRKRVDWPTLVNRLKAATAGQTPVIQ